MSYVDKRLAELEKFIEEYPDIMEWDADEIESFIQVFRDDIIKLQNKISMAHLVIRSRRVADRLEILNKAKRG